MSDDGIEVAPSSGGLAVALQAVRGDAAWVGWPGTVVPPEQERRVRRRLRRDNLAPVLLTPQEEEDFYNRVCNDTLWPLFHYFSDRLRITPEAWARYVEVNERFADVILECTQPGSRVWIHDFHLMLVPGLLRRRDPSLSIGFFLHTPFPSSEVYRLLPGREQLLRGVLGADYVSFQIGDYARHFRSSVLRILGVDSEPDWLEIDGRRVGIGVDPIGIDTEGFRATLNHPETARLLAELDSQYEGRRLVLGVVCFLPPEATLLLAVAPEKVRMDLAAPGCTAPLSTILPARESDGVAAVSPSGVLGDPTGASAAEGAQLLDELASALSAAVAAWPA